MTRRGQPDSWAFDWYRTWDEVFSAAFVARWDALRKEDRHTTVYHRPEVVRAWAETCGVASGCEPLFGIASRSGVTILLPWVVATYRGRLMTRRVIEAAGQDLFGYHDPVVAGPDADGVQWNEFWGAARMAAAPFGHQVLMRSVRVDRAGDAGIPAEAAPVLHLDRARSLEDLLAACSANHRGDVQRRFRRLAERGSVSLHIATATMSAGFDDLCAAYEDRREARPAYPSLERPGLRELWRRAATDGVAQGWAHLSALHVDTQPVAWHLGLFDERELYWWVPAHARTFEPLSPGKVLLASLVSHGIESGWQSIHFLSGAQPYKLAWRPAVPERCGLRWHAPTLVGSVLQQYERAAAPVSPKQLCEGRR
jgi:CelD/BcsL family acetyltransferase involved in cellulose biosynthesis